MFTQTFAAVPDQLPSPSSGSIGLGSVTGTVGAVRTDQAKKDNAAAGRGERQAWVRAGVMGAGVAIAGLAFH